MNTQDIIRVLKQHSSIEEVPLEKSKDMTDLWEQFIHTVYHNSNIEKLFWDDKLRETMAEFQSEDSLVFVNGKGRLLKRYAYFHKNKTGQAIPDNVMGIVGDCLQSIITSENTVKYFVDFTNKFDWDDGDYGKSGSCWWGLYSDSLPTFEENGGWCARFYDENGNGIGRTWIYPNNNVMLGFNSYGVERAKVSKVIKKIFLSHGHELHYSTCNIENSHSSNIPYINGGTGFVLYTEETQPYSEYDLNMRVVEGEPFEQCENCRCRINMDSGYYNVVGDYIYCDNCTRQLFSYCDKCGEFCDKDEVHKVADSSYRYDYACEYCAARIGLYGCSDCGNYTQYPTMAEDTGNCFCSHCDTTFHCEHCGNDFENDECPNCVIEEEENEN